MADLDADNSTTNQAVFTQILVDVEVVTDATMNETCATVNDVEFQRFLDRCGPNGGPGQNKTPPAFLLARVLPAAQTAHRGRHGAYGEWSIAAYRRLLIALRLRESGIADVKDIRLRLRLAGHRVDDRFAIADLAHGYRQQVRSAQREMPGVADGHMRARPPLRMRREVERVVTVFRPTEYVTTLAADEERWLEELRMDPRTKPVFLAITDLMYRGPSEAVIAHLKDAATLMPRWMFEQPAQIIEATALASGALAPDRSHSVARLASSPHR